MQYRYYKPPPAVSSCVECIVEFEDDGSLCGIPMNIVPNGLAEIAIHYGDKPNSYILAPAGNERAYLYGPTSKTGFYWADGVTKCICILFTFYGAYRVLGYRQSDLADNAFGLEEICGKQGKELVEKVVNASTPSQRKLAVESFLIRQLHRNSVSRNLLLDSACEQIYRRGGMVKIREMCERFGVSERTFQRLFRSFLGLTPKQFSRIVRVNHTYKCMKSKKDAQTRLALSCGYYDQSHFIREFKTFTGYSPEVLNRSIDTNVVYLNRMYTLCPEPVEFSSYIVNDSEQL